MTTVNVKKKNPYRGRGTLPSQQPFPHPPPLRRSLGLSRYAPSLCAPSLRNSWIRPWYLIIYQIKTEVNKKKTFSCLKS